MDKSYVYPGAIPLELDALAPQVAAETALTKLAQALLGSSRTTVRGLAVTPTSPASMSVNVSDGEIYQMAARLPAAFSSVAADTTHQTLKQGINLDATTLTLTAPATNGQSINYLVQATLLEQDADSTLFMYYNAANPSQAFTGPNGQGTSQPRTRKCSIALQAKAGTAAATGSQTTPAPDAGWVGLYVVTVAYGATTVTAGNISRYSGAPILGAGGVTASMASNGYQVLPSGLIVQWGNATTNASGRATVTFPITFPTAALWAMSGVAATALSNYAVANGPPSATTLELYSNIGGSTTAASLSAWWLAIGW